MTPANEHEPEPRPGARWRSFGAILEIQADDSRRTYRFRRGSGSKLPSGWGICPSPAPPGVGR